MNDDVTPEDIEFLPTIILESKREATAEEIKKLKLEFDDDVEKLILQTKDFSEQVMVDNGLFYTNFKDQQNIFFHNIFGVREDENFGSVFLACYPGEKGAEFDNKADVILHLNIMSDLELNSQVADMNKNQVKLNAAYSYFYFNIEQDSFTKRVLVPPTTQTDRKVIQDTNAYKLLESKITDQDLVMIKKVMKDFLEKMKLTEKSKILS
jgi:hypothetical protein